MKTTTKQTFSQEQVVYMAAKATLETARKHSDAKIIDQAWRTLVYAEEALIDWARNEVANNPKTAAKFGQVAVVFEKAPKNPKFRPQLIDLCMRFAA